MNIKISAERLNDAIKKNNISPTSLAHRLNCSKQTIYNWRKSEGIISVRFDLIKAAAKILHCSIDYLTQKVSSPNEKEIDGKEMKILDLTSAPYEIAEHIKHFSPEQLSHLSSLINILEYYDCNQWELFLRVASAISNTSFIMSNQPHPFEDWDAFRRIFQRTFASVQEVRKSLTNTFNNQLPDKLDNALTLCTDSVLKDFQCLSRPFQSTIFFKQSMKHTRQSIHVFCRAIDELNIESQKKSAFKRIYEAELKKAFSSDIEIFLSTRT